MSSFNERSLQKELLDSNNVPFEHIRRNMEELNAINRWLGGHAITKQGIATLLHTAPAGEPVRIVEIGCGGGDNLREIGRWAQKKKIRVVLTGIDINPECVAFARSLESNGHIQFICSDFRSATLDYQPHVVFSSLFCHHFTDGELVPLLHWMHRHSSIGFFINDLHRHALAFHSIRILTHVFSRSYLVKNDAPLSVKRGFRRQEWNNIFHHAGLSPFSCKWKWAFRWLVVYHHHHGRAKQI